MPKRQNSSTSAFTRSSIAARNLPASFPPTATNSTPTAPWAKSKKFSRPTCLNKLPGSTSIGHTRYSTAGDKALLNAQPIMIDCNKGKIALGHNGNLTNAAEWRRRLEHRGSIFQTNSDTEVVVHLVAKSAARNLSGALGDALNQVEGAYSLVVLTPDELYAVRDPRGFRPLDLGRLISPNGERSLDRRQRNLRLRSSRRAICSRNRTRRNGAHLANPALSPFTSRRQSRTSTAFSSTSISRGPTAKFSGAASTPAAKCSAAFSRSEYPVEADLVVPVPDSGVPAAVGYAMESGIPFRMGLIRNHYIGRTFIEPSQAIRNFGVKLKLNPIRGLIEGKRVILVDDSIVRGTTSRKIVRMVREAGATEVHVRICCPPTISPCYYGVDTPTREELIASSNTPEEICRFLGADSLGYISMAGLKQAVGDTQGDFCTSCYTGVYPTDLVQLEVREGGSNGQLLKDPGARDTTPVQTDGPVTVTHES